MRLLVSVRDAGEAAAALAGGADIIDAKDPAAGPLGAVSPDAFIAIAGAVGAVRPLTAALGDASDERHVEALAWTFVRAGAHLVKLGLAECDADRARTMLGAAARGAGAGRVVAVAYADHQDAAAPAPADVLRLAAWMGLAGVLMDTAHKAGPGLRDLMSPSAIASWVAQAQRGSLVVALAGKLTGEDAAALALAEVRPDIVGIRGAACEGGRDGHVSADRVRALVRTLGGAQAPPLRAPEGRGTSSRGPWTSTAARS